MFNIGTDIQDIAFFEAKPFEQNERFYRRVFRDAEIEYCLRHADPAQHFAARFAAKEAVVKALGTDRIVMTQVEVSLAEDGSPSVLLHREGALPAGCALKVSLSHSATHAAATALLHPVA